MEYITYNTRNNPYEYKDYSQISKNALPPSRANDERTRTHTVPYRLTVATLKHIFQKNAIEFETRATRHEQRDTRQEDNLYDSVCDVMRFRIFTEISV